MSTDNERRHRHVALVGLSGTGKSTIAPLIAVRLGTVSVDIDLEIERRTGQPIAALFAERGESAFRDLEQAALFEALDGPRAVIATGGGVVIREANRVRLAERSTAVWLRATPEHLAERLESGTEVRPLLGQDPVAALRRLAVEREAFYRGVADVTVDTEGRSTAELVDQIVTGVVEAP